MKPVAPHLLKYLLATAALNHGVSHASAPTEVVLRPTTQGSGGAIATESIECSTIGRDLLARGGNAADALVGSTFCVGVIGMYHSGIGGGGFAMIRDADGSYEAVDFREAAGEAASQDMYQGNVDGSIYGGLAVGVPSEVLGLEYIHKKYGALSWKTVMQGSIHVARNGFKVSKDLIHYIENTVKGKPRNFLLEDPNWAEDFAPNGTLLKVGEIMTRKRYANTLEKIANHGSDIFYNGELAEAMVKHIQQHNGTLTVSDFQNYKVVSRPVRNTTYRGINLYTVGAPASGSITLNILKTMEQYDVSKTTTTSSDANLTAHRFVEAMRFGYGARASLGDPDFVKGVGEFEAHLLDAAHARQTKEHISDDHTLPVQEYDPSGVDLPQSHGTSHIVTTDKSGMATSLTTTVNLLFGAQIMEPSSGIILNNEMNDFSIPGVSNEFGFQPSEANFIRPFKRPLSSVTPVIAAFPDGTLSATVGAAGGSRIISATTLALWHTIGHGMTMSEALLEPRLHDQVIPNTVLLEYKFDNSTAAGLIGRKHSVTWVKPGLSAVQGIRRLEDGSFEAASEPRQENSAGLTI
ncbi:hypothetical protein QQS21_009355 [Conoideocrella luteorostrata]|uniref:Glutathione hydrolase n=1 Tax=Conoideocrella luteorostrata TaxID=1105319 RepID=A0AAJ0FVQ3_9HYPO|nr:hypothetical protein QQS21_009355 [Conoideocrella luteorostrata]